MDGRFGDISAFVQGIASGNPVAVFSALPGLQQTIQDLLSPVTGGEADIQRNQALQARTRIQESPLSGAHQVELTNQLDFLIRELTIRYIRSLPEAYANATIAQQTAFLAQEGFDFDYGRDVRDLQQRGVQFGGFGEAPGEARIIDLDVFLKDLGDAIKLATEGRAGDSAAETKKRREGTLPQAGELGVESVVGAAPPAPVVRDLAAVVGASPVVFSTEIESILTEMRTDIASIASEGVIVRNIPESLTQPQAQQQPQRGCQTGEAIRRLSRCILLQTLPMRVKRRLFNFTSMSAWCRRYLYLLRVWRSKIGWRESRIRIVRGR